MCIARFSEKEFKTQSVREHTFNVAELCKIFGKKLNIQTLAYLSGLLHDMGKYSPEFQVYINEKLDKAKNKIEDKSGETADKVDHGVYGAKYIYEKFHGIDQLADITSEVIALVCCYHHGGLPDCVNSNTKITLTERFDTIKSKQMADVYDAFINDINIERLFDSACAEINNIIVKIKELGDETYFALHLLIKSVYSMLIDADRYDSYLFEINSSAGDIESVDNTLIWNEYLNRLENKLEGFKNQFSSGENEKRINKIRQEISDECLELAKCEEGIYTLTVPTGGGKTLSSLRYALRHAELKNKDRIVYVVPYTTIIDQNADEVRKALKCGDELLEHHSNVLMDDKGENYRMLTHRWSDKIIYTTMVQFLNTFYNKGTQDMRRIHNLMNSIIIFDEIQTIPIKCIELFNSCINYLNVVGNSTIVLCSATQPELNKSNVAIKFAKHREIIKNVNEKFEILERVEVLDKTRKEGYTYDEAASFVYDIKQSVKSALMVCNTVNSAESIFDILANTLDKDTELYFLSSNLCPAHRKEIIKKIKDGLKEQKHVVCVSTQLIEAGVDISFNATIRALAGLDSVAQTSGRCNRNGENEKGYCYIINLRDESISKLTEIRLGKTHCNELLNEYNENKSEFGNSLLSPKAIEAYFKYYYSDKELNNNMNYPIKNSSIYDMLDYNEANINGYEDDYPLQFMYKFKTAAESFKVIDNDTVTILVPYDKGEKLITELLNNSSVKEKKEVLNKLGQYSVNVFRNKYDALVEEKGIVILKEYGIIMLKDAFYDSLKGITLNKKQELLSY